jgi:hypothetical protein
MAQTAPNSSVTASYSTGRRSNIGTSAVPGGDDRFSGGERLHRYGGYVTGLAKTFAAALKVSREAVIHAVDGDKPVESEILVNGNRGTDNPGGSTNRIRSEDYPDRDGVDAVFVALTTDQFERLAEAVGRGGEVSVS